MIGTHRLCIALCLLLSGAGRGYAAEANAPAPSPSAAIGLEHQFYGDFANRSSNLYLTSFDYNAVSGWSENRLILGTWKRDRHRVRPYLKTTAVLSAHALAWENALVNGVGIEYRPWVDNNRLTQSGFAWVTSLRTYAEYLSLSYLKDKSWSPTDDFRVGVDLWRERGLDRKSERRDGSYEFSPQWSEVYANLAYQKTNFYLSDYNSLVCYVSTRAGIRSPRISRDVSLMPYVAAEIGASGRPYFWQNRAILGVGVRVMPFQHSNSSYLNKTKLYVEYLRIVDYFGDKPTAGTVPSEDLRLGVSFSVNRK